MNYTFIILGIILLVIIFILYKVFTEKKTKIESSKTLSANTHYYTDLKNPGSPKYYIGIWLYVRSLPSSGVTKCIYDIKDSTKILGLFLDDNAKLSYKYDNETKQQPIMDGFPLQRWTHVILSVDSNKLIDTYVDGKLMMSHNVSLTQPNATSELRESAGSDTNIIDAEIAGFERVPTTMNPQTAWKKYLAGNGGNAFTRFFKTWGISLVLTKDDVDQKALSFPP
jgi:hypothetical protein